mgnify:CR=1 FL=1
MNAVLAGLLTLHGPLVYVAISALVFLEAAAFIGLVVPGETAMLVAGVLAARGNISLTMMIVLAAVAAVSGDSVGYAIGIRYGPAVERSRAGQWVGRERWERAHRAVGTRGAWAVVIGRFIGVLRALVPAVAGMAGMPYPRFLAANALGGVLWVVTVIGAGFAAGGSLVVAQQVLGKFSVVGTIIMLALVMGAVASSRARRAGRTNIEGRCEGCATLHGRGAVPSVPGVDTISVAGLAPQRSLS